MGDGKVEWVGVGVCKIEICWLKQEKELGQGTLKKQDGIHTVYSDEKKKDKNVKYSCCSHLHKNNGPP